MNYFDCEPDQGHAYSLPEAIQCFAVLISWTNFELFQTRCDQMWSFVASSVLTAGTEKDAGSAVWRPWLSPAQPPGVVYGIMHVTPPVVTLQPQWPQTCNLGFALTQIICQEVTLALGYKEILQMTPMLQSLMTQILRKRKSEASLWPLWLQCHCRWCHMY